MRVLLSAYGSRGDAQPLVGPLLRCRGGARKRWCVLHQMRSLRIDWTVPACR
jgi:hypothetical protein